MTHGATRAPPRAAARKPKAGRSADATAERRKLFVLRYLVNGHNARDAAIHAGYSAASAKKQGWALLHDPDVAQEIRRAAQETAHLAELDATEWVKHVRALAFATPRDLIGGDGELIPLHLLPDHVQAAIASVDFKSGRVSKIRLWDKNVALTTAARHLGLFQGKSEGDGGNQITIVGGLPDDE